MKEWFTHSEMANAKLPGMPTTQSAFRIKCLREGWEKTDLARQRGRGKCNRAREYHYSLLSAAVNAELLHKYNPGFSSKIVNSHQKIFTDAGRALLGVLKKHGLELAPLPPDGGDGA